MNQIWCSGSFVMMDKSGQSTIYCSMPFGRMFWQNACIIVWCTFWAVYDEAGFVSGIRACKLGRKPQAKSA